MKKIVLVLFLSLILTACSKNKNEPASVLPTSVPTEALTSAPSAAPTKSPEVIVKDEPTEPFDEKGRAVAVFGTPVIDGSIDELWDTAGAIAPSVIFSPGVRAAGEFRLLWDDNALHTLYIVTDPVLNKSSINTYEQDSVEIFLDELNDKASSYQSDDVHYRVNYENTPSTDAGDDKRFYTAVSKLLDNSGNQTGYIVETSLAWSNKPVNNQVMGFELQINDANAAGVRLGTLNIFDKTGTAWSNPGSMGEIILKGKGSGFSTEVNPHMLTAYVKYVEAINPKGYVNSDILIDPLKTAKDLLNNPSATQKEIDAALKELRDTVGRLDDGSGFVKVKELPENTDFPDPFTFFNGDKAVTREDWSRRATELSGLYQYYMYGALPDTSNEKVSYEVEGNNLNITVEKADKKVTFPVPFSVPDQDKVPMPEGGYPVIIAYLFLRQTAYANEHGYAAMTVNTELIAADNTSRTGAFYELYPYGTVWQEQTGVLMAWSWGISKIIDALEAGAGSELGINPEYSIVTGVSRWGKAAAVAGAFDQRIKVTAPSCSGAGGMASFRYSTEGKTYDYTDLGVASPYKMTANEPLSSLQSSAERQWFNDNFLEFDDVSYLPFDQHLLAAMCAENDRYLYITGSYLYEDWTNPPAMWLTYLQAREIFDFLGIEDNIAIHIHKEGHMVTDEDMVYLLDYCDYHFYGKESESNLEDLKSSLFMEEANYDSIFDKYIK